MQIAIDMKRVALAEHEEFEDGMAPPLATITTGSMLHAAC